MTLIHLDDTRPVWRQRLDSIVNFLSGFGDPRKDKGAAGRPRAFVPLTENELRSLYRCNGHARRWVDVMPDEGTRKGWRVDVTEAEEEPEEPRQEPPEGDEMDTEAREPQEAPDVEDDVDETAGLDVMHDEDRRLHVWSKVGDASRWGRRDGGAWIMVVTDEDFAGEDTGIGERLREPLDLDSLRSVDNLVVVTKDDVDVWSYESNIRDPNYRQPKIYNVTLTARGDVDREPGETSIEGSSILVHNSRMIYFEGATVDDRTRFENGGVGDSILQAAWDQIRNLTTIEQAGANLAQEMHLHVLKIGGLATMQAQDQLALLEGRMRLIAKSKASTGLIVMGDGEEYQTLAANVTGFREFQGTAKDALAAVAGIPQTILFGQAPGGLSTDDGAGREQMNTLIATWQWHKLKLPLVQLYTILFSQADGPTSGEVPEQWDLNFNPVSELSAPEQAGLEKTHAETDQIRINSGVTTPEHVAKSRHGKAGYQNQLGAIDIEELEQSAFAELDKVRAELAAAQMGTQEPPGEADEPPEGEGEGEGESEAPEPPQEPEAPETEPPEDEGDEDEEDGA
jgi:phage-related protein (TIGR01555 family)